MKGSLVVILTLLIFGILDGIGGRTCNGGEIPLHFHQIRRETTSLRASRRLRSDLFRSNIYPAPKPQRERHFSYTPPKLQPPLEQPEQPSPPSPPPPPPFFRYISGGERPGNRGGMIP
ncbi:hypothetical protein HRI_004792800 [Hibiscus trionum]|uniref:Uncharacterized protein n=1 Tax=Hibiscus trionum TaxID=183268 RepID=A0A9W7JAZ6_HIBTR|nr:hypothetical protein HRI_004792800 [Hibiscus trionum]